MIHLTNIALTLTCMTLFAAGYITATYLIHLMTAMKRRQYWNKQVRAYWKERESFKI